MRKMRKFGHPFPIGAAPHHCMVPFTSMCGFVPLPHPHAPALPALFPRESISLSLAAISTHPIHLHSTFSANVPVPTRKGGRTKISPVGVMYIHRYMCVGEGEGGGEGEGEGAGARISGRSSCCKGNNVMRILVSAHGA